MCSSKKMADKFGQVGFIDHDRTLLHQMVVLFAHDANDGFEQRVTGTDERCHGLLVHLALLEADAFHTSSELESRADLPVTLADADRDMGDLPSTLSRGLI